jgi:hypothetical protein
MTDDEFLHAFTTATLANEQFHHRDQLRMTWLMLHRLGLEAGAEAVMSGIRHFAGVHGHAPKYHETMTRFWIWMVDHAMRTRPEISSFVDFVDAFPIVLDKTLPFRHWSHDRLMSPAARAAWLDPDLLALPAA